MALVYEMVGRVVVTLVRRRFGRQLKLGGLLVLAAGVVGGAAVAYLLASREVDEG
jgi:hypothetical protein